MNTSSVYKWPQTPDRNRPSGTMALSFRLPASANRNPDQCIQPDFLHHLHTTTHPLFSPSTSPKWHTTIQSRCQAPNAAHASHSPLLTTSPRLNRSVPRPRPPLIKQVLEIRARRPLPQRRATGHMQIERAGARARGSGRAGTNIANSRRRIPAAAAVAPHVVGGTPRRRQHGTRRRRRPEVALRRVAGARGAAAERVEVREARGCVAGEGRRRRAADDGGRGAARRGGCRWRGVVPGGQEGRAAVCGEGGGRRRAVRAGAGGRREEQVGVAGGGGVRADDGTAVGGAREARRLGGAVRGVEAVEGDGRERVAAFAVDALAVRLLFQIGVVAFGCALDGSVCLVVNFRNFFHLQFLQFLCSLV